MENSLSNRHSIVFPGINDRGDRLQGSGRGGGSVPHNDLLDAHGDVGESPNAGLQKKVVGYATESLGTRDAGEPKRCELSPEEQCFEKAGGKRRRLGGTGKGKCTTVIGMPEKCDILRQRKSFAEGPIRVTAKCSLETQECLQTTVKDGARDVDCDGRPRRSTIVVEMSNATFNETGRIIPKPCPIATSVVPIMPPPSRPSQHKRRTKTDNAGLTKLDRKNAAKARQQILRLAESSDSKGTSLPAYPLAKVAILPPPAQLESANGAEHPEGVDPDRRLGYLSPGPIRHGGPVTVYRPGDSDGNPVTGTFGGSPMKVVQKSVLEASLAQARLLASVQAYSLTHEGRLARSRIARCERGGPDGL
jgi:hypothetical protein